MKLLDFLRNSDKGSWVAHGLWGFFVGMFAYFTGLGLDAAVFALALAFGIKEGEELPDNLAAANLLPVEERMSVKSDLIRDSALDFIMPFLGLALFYAVNALIDKL